MHAVPMLCMPLIYKTRPISIQLELTYACNNACGFCYNNLDGTGNQKTVPYDRLKIILADMREYGVFSINFNGGEPLLYTKFFDLAQLCSELGFDIHFNTNATLIDEKTAVRIAQLFPAVCSSLHGATPEKHDLVVGRTGAFAQAVAGIKHLVANNVYVAVNVTVTKQNQDDIGAILQLLSSLGVGTLLLSRVLTNDSAIAVSDAEFLTAVETVFKFQTESRNQFARIGLPQPFPPCRIGSHSKLLNFICESNVPCSAGLATARITPEGDITPCPVLDAPIIGNIKTELFSKAWDGFLEDKWTKTGARHQNCNECSFLKVCGGGCLPCDQSGCLLNN
ncbi:MAG: radical SAM protein [Clostridiales bacterium]|nr:radical SAM protein [Clostridiales bacterium]